MKTSTQETFTVEIQRRFADMVNNYLTEKSIDFEIVEQNPECIKLKIHQMKPAQAFYLGVRLQKNMTEGIGLV